MVSVYKIEKPLGKFISTILAIDDVKNNRIVKHAEEKRNKCIKADYLEQYHTELGVLE